MAKISSAFFCSNCGASSPKWIGKCPYCGEWNTYHEEILSREKKASGTHGSSKSKRKSNPQSIGDISAKEGIRFDTGNQEFNRVLGGGIVPGSLILLGGEPGIGKSTLMLQLCLGLGNRSSLYISGEESEQQIRLRAERIGQLNKQCYILAETSAEVIIKHIQDIEPVVVVVDSIQTLASELLDSGAGSVSQIRECAAIMLKFAKEAGIPIILVGHITKDGSLAGPKILEHMVDTVLQFEGDRNYGYRILRAVKNRFGSTSELGIFEMMGSGLREVSNPSELLLSSREEELSGSATAAAVEGLRPMLIEIQSLVSTAAYGTPQRSATGFDVRRLNMLLAVLEKRCGFRLGIKDVFLNIAGGIKVDDPAIDLAVIAAILSSNEDIAIEQNIAFAAEIGLSGELRPVSRIEQRISEAEKMGFKAIILSKYNFKNTKNMPSRNIEVVALSKVDDVFSYLFG